MKNVISIVGANLVVAQVVQEFDMTDEQKYMFDLNGYIVLENVLPNEVMDACHKANECFFSHLWEKVAERSEVG